MYYHLIPEILDFSNTPHTVTALTIQPLKLFRKK